MGAPAPVGGATVVPAPRPLLCARRALRRAGPLAASVQTASGWRLAAGTASVQSRSRKHQGCTRATLPGLTEPTHSLLPGWRTRSRVHAHDYSCIARGRCLWPPGCGELLRGCSRTSPCWGAACSSRTTIAAWPGCTPGLVLDQRRVIALCGARLIVQALRGAPSRARGSGGRHVPPSAAIPWRDSPSCPRLA